MVAPSRWLSLSLLALASCGTASERQQSADVEATGNAIASIEAPVVNQPVAASVAPTAVSVPAAGRPTACSVQIGAAAAAKRVKVCRNVSPATHPPCNAANSCAMIEDEIARSCALFDGKGPPMAGCGPTPTSAAAAAAVVERYYSALNARDYDTAWQQWGEGGPPNQTRAKFEAGFARTRSTKVTIGKLAPGDAGAGSVYQPVPVMIDATLSDGTHQRFGGEYVVRRVNGVDGASPDQLRWHIGSARLTKR